MALLGAAVYDPATAVTNKATALQAMTAVDTTNCRVTFTAPNVGAFTGTRDVLVRMKATQHGGTGGGVNSILLGVLEGATVMGRIAAIGAGRMAAATTARCLHVGEFVIKGITSGSHSYDLAIGVENATNLAAVKYGGPNDTTSDNAWGAISLEVWEATNLLAAANYDPTTAVNKSLGTLIAMTAHDTTNLRCTFTAPASGRVMVVQNSVWSPPSTTFAASPMLGVLEGATVVARGPFLGGIPGGAGAIANVLIPIDWAQVVTGISAGSHSYDAAYGVETILASANIRYGGPNNATADDAAGMYRFEVWAA